MFAYNLLQIYSLNIIAVWILLLCTVLIYFFHGFPLKRHGKYLFIYNTVFHAYIGYNLLVKTAHFPIV